MRGTAVLLCLIMANAGAAEGMWTLDNLPEAELQARYGFQPTREWIATAMRAPVRLAQGCSGSFVSPDGLVMTNHHCSMRCIEALSSSSKNYVRDGYLANERAAELRCPELELNRLEQITDVTAQIKAAVQGREGERFKLALNAVKARLTGTCTGTAGASVRCDVVELYHGGLYHLYRYRRFQDVRLVWAPEQGVAFFGGDPDNFNFPRYALDIALLRAYENGKPVKIQQYFRFNPAGAAPGELVFVLGHPGSTQRELTTAQLATLRDVRYLRELQLLSEQRGMLQQYQKIGAEPARIAAGDVFSIENSIKAYRGAMKALQDEALWREKRQAESSLEQYVAGHPELAHVAGAWQAIAAAEAVYREIGLEYYFVEAGRGFGSKYFGFARILLRGAAERAKPDAERLPEFTDAQLPAVEQSLLSGAPVYPDYERLKLAWSLTKLREWLGADHAVVRKVFGAHSPEQLAERWVSATELGDPAVRKTLWNDPAAVAASHDPFIQLAGTVDEAARSLRRRYESEIEAVEQRAGQAIAAARFHQLGTSVYPDATFTLRLSYGEVRGWSEPGRSIEPYTTIAGAFARHTDAEPFALPASWLQAKSRLAGDTRLNFVTTHDIIGGNSGSPMINRRGELVGLVFDHNIPALGGGFWYDERLYRSVAVHPAAVVETLDKVYGAGKLLKEIAGR